MKDGDWLGWGPMHHWTDSKIRIHAFYCMLGVSLLNYLRLKAERVCPRITMEQMLAELGQIEQYVVLYPRLGERGPYRTVTVQKKLTLTQKMLSEHLGLDRLAKDRVGKTETN
ncbi:MAG: hypothetical protein HXY20_14660 [Acidobacteria bacterium]|nr:hypothetical protein [Acidobacteriota bacterium]